MDANKFTSGFIVLMVSIFMWHIILLCLADESKVQKYRFRKALERILAHLQTVHPKYAPELDIIHKNRKFAIGIIFKEVNNRYSTYSIFINGEGAAIFHRLEHLGYSSYYLEEANKRHKGEVISIIFAANRDIKRLNKPKKEKTDGYSEYSYFK